ncbi:MAG: DUF2254 domain-containing protein [Pirellulaceae bacterium]|nr:DUF2254 domain-containing protein [Pirellulaceae bacterium]
MRARIQQWLYKIQGSYWFVPALMAISAILLSQATIQLDRNYNAADWMSDSWWASLNQPDGARSLLATVAGSMITVAGVTFSLTILAVSYATSHFGPRLITNFMRDRGNQITLGTFVATFLYCLLVLRTVRSAGSSDDTILQTDVFVPHVSILIAIALTLSSVGVLIYFIHHIPESIHISTVLHRISQDLDDKIDAIFPAEPGKLIDEQASQLLAIVQDAPNVLSKRSGYLQGVDPAELVDFACENQAVVELLVQPGDHLLVGQPIARVKFDVSDLLDADVCTSRISSAFAMGIERTPTQDMRFLINQFVEIAARALSPGVNDPFTAIQCIDQLGDGISRLSHRELPSRFREDSEGVLRLIRPELTWDVICEHAFGRLVHYVKPDPNVKAHMQETIRIVCGISNNLEINRCLCDISNRLND